MSAQRDERVTWALASKADLMGMVLVRLAVEAALEALQEGGYRPTPKQLTELSRRLTMEGLAAGLGALKPAPEWTDDDIARAAELSGRDAVREICGPPPVVQ